MRTVTEFPGVVLRQVIGARSTIVAAGTTADEEIQAKLGEQFKVDGERLTHLLKAVSLTTEKADSIARVRVFAGEDETKMPKGVHKEGEFYYLVEFVPVPVKAEKHDRSKDRDGKGKGKHGGKKGGRGGRDGNDRGGRNSKDGRRDQRPEGGPAAQTSASPTPRPAIKPVSAS